MSGDLKKRADSLLPHTRGFTLIEVLIVLVIVTIMTAIAVMSFGHFGRTRREKMILEQFSATITAAQQQAIFTPVVMGLVITKQGYRYDVYQPAMEGSPAHWKPVAGMALTHQTVFRGVFDDVQLQSMAASDIKKNANPSIFFLPSGYVTPFTLRLEGNTHAHLVSVKSNGEVTQVVREKE